MSICEFDVFLSHNSSDKPAVRELAGLLRQYGLRVWLDEDELQPGIPWQGELEKAIKVSKAGAVLIGKDGLGPWEDEEMQALLRLVVRSKIPVIPVLLRGASAQPELPQFLGNRTWVDLRGGFTERGVDRLVWGITGSKPQRKPAATASPAAAIAVSKLPHGAEVLVGRTRELGLLTRAWNDPKTHVVSIVAWGGVGKTALAVEWTGRFAQRDWEGVEAYFDWSFYSHGTREQGAASADQFIAAALRHFGDPDPQSGSPYDRGERLARRVAGRRTLLILDGLEPLQYGPGPLEGKLKDPALEALLRGLAQLGFAGLFVLTSREKVADLNPFHGKTVTEWELENLSEEAGAQLLHRAGANRAGPARIGPDDQELREASKQVDGHALTLRLLGRYLALAHGGDVRRRDRVKFQKADANTQGGHAFRVIAAYERWLEGEEKRGFEQERTAETEIDKKTSSVLPVPSCSTFLAVLRLLGLFDRPVGAGCLEALRSAPAIARLTEPLVGLEEEDWNATLFRLAKLGLIRLDARGSSPVDAHPLVREYFGRQVREERPEAWRAAHRRLYEHLCETTDYQPDTLEGLEPLYQAVAHGCQAGVHQDVLENTYKSRILRGTEIGDFFSTYSLGAIGADLGAVACFFDKPWSLPSPDLSPADQTWLLNEAAIRLQCLGRLSEAMNPSRAALEGAIEVQNWAQGAVCASNLSQLELTLGRVSAAVSHGDQAVRFTERGGRAFAQGFSRTTYADALHQAGHRAKSLALFCAAEAIQAQDQQENPRLYAVRGFQYCDRLLAEAEREAWWAMVCPESKTRNPKVVSACDEVAERATETIKIAERHNWLLPIALDLLTLGRAALYRAILDEWPRGSNPSSFILRRAISDHLDGAADGLRQAGMLDNLPRGLITRAWLRFLQGDESGCRADVDEAQQIAERGPMPLHLADVHLTRGRLFRDRESLALARQLIQKHGYGRRDGELADAEKAMREERGEKRDEG